MTRRGGSPERLTLDHIIPRALGGPNVAENLRPLCKLCNVTLPMVGHCVGALACVRACVGRTTVSETLKWWRRAARVAE